MPDRPWNAPRTEYVYLVSAEGEWPVDAIAHDHPSAPERVEAEVKRRQEGDRMRRIHVWRIPVTGLVELELIEARTVEAELRVKTDLSQPEEP